MALLPQRKSARRICMAAIAISVLFQLVAVRYLGNSVSGGDADTYLRLSQDWLSLDRLLSPGAFEGNFWPAGYSGFLALFSKFGANQVLVVRVIQILMVIGIAIMSSRIARCYSERAATITLVVVVFNPTLIWAVWAIGYELLLGFLISLALVAIWFGTARTAKFAAVVSGIALGLALIVQFRAAVVLPVLLFVAWKQGARVCIAFLVGLVMPLGLWALRTWISIGQPRIWSENGGYNLWDGNSPVATGHNIYPLPPIPHGESSQASAALHWISNNPSDFFDLVVRKFGFLFYPTQFADVTAVLPFERGVTVLQWLYALVVVVALLAFVGAWVWKLDTRLSQLRVALVYSGLFLMLNVFFIVEARFRIPVEGVLIAVAIPTIMELWVRRGRSHTETSGLATLTRAGK